jgi:hypothetical protein
LALINSVFGTVQHVFLTSEKRIDPERCVPRHVEEHEVAQHTNAIYLSGAPSPKIKLTLLAVPFHYKVSFRGYL